MKKIFSLLAVSTAIFFTSCSKDQVVNDAPNNANGAINFRTFVPSSLRGTATTLTDAFTFKVDAYGNGGTYFKDETSTAKNAVESGFWHIKDKTYFWPTYNLTFVAHSPLTLPTNNTITTSATETKISLSTPDAIKEQKDILVATVKDANKTAFMTAGVPLHFDHVLSQVVVKAKNSSTAYNVKVAAVKVARINSTGTFTHDNATTTSPTLFQPATVTVEDTPKTFAATAGSTALTLDTTEKDLMASEAFFFVPQTITAWNQSGVYDAATDKATGTADNNGSYLAIAINVSTTAGGIVYPEGTGMTVDSYGWAAIPFNQAFEPGKKYIFNIEFFAADGGGVGFEDPKPGDNVTPADLPSGSTITPTPKPTPVPGRPILDTKNPIKFTVTIEDYTEVTIPLTPNK